MLALMDYRSVMVIAEEGHFGRAARRLAITQPALSSRLRRIEEALGVRLFERDRGGVAVTPAGAAFIEGAERVVTAADEAAEGARNAQAGLGQTIRIGMTQIAAYQVVAPALDAFRRAHTRARIRLFEGTTAALERQLEQNLIDVAFLHPPIHAPGLSVHVVARTRLAQFDARPDHSLQRPLIRYPRAEAPVLMGEIERVSDGLLGAFPEVEADTMLGAIVLSHAGFGPFVVPQDYPSPFEKTEACLDADIMPIDLETAIVWRSLDRRTILTELVACAKGAGVERV